jgi:hypothetical protein
MPDVSERLVVHCPDHEASHYLAAFVAEHQVGGGTMRIGLRLPISMLADRQMRIEHGVIATLISAVMDRDPHPTYSVTWLPNGDGPSREFAGALAVEQSPHDDCFDLILKRTLRTGQRVVRCARPSDHARVGRATCARSRIMSRTRAPITQRRTLATARGRH